ncbi:hypothetical protein CDD83_5237 [Cordyceps sp. RAO-2017]|nr:hypothetical protein CDD83_5237 [Cordyceps sp. RAO-2017]
MFVPVLPKSVWTDGTKKYVTIPDNASKNQVDCARLTWGSYSSVSEKATCLVKDGFNRKRNHPLRGDVPRNPLTRCSDWEVPGLKREQARQWICVYGSERPRDYILCRGLTPTYAFDCVGPDGAYRRDHPRFARDKDLSKERVGSGGEICRTTMGWSLARHTWVPDVYSGPPTYLDTPPPGMLGQMDCLRLEWGLVDRCTGGGEECMESIRGGYKKGQTDQVSIAGCSDIHEPRHEHGEAQPWYCVGQGFPGGTYALCNRVEGGTASYCTAMGRDSKLSISKDMLGDPDTIGIKGDDPDAGAEAGADPFPPSPTVKRDDACHGKYAGLELPARRQGPGQPMLATGQFFQLGHDGKLYKGYACMPFSKTYYLARTPPEGKEAACIVDYKRLWAGATTSGNIELDSETVRGCERLMQTSFDIVPIKAVCVRVAAWATEVLGCWGLKGASMVGCVHIGPVVDIK